MACITHLRAVEEEVGVGVGWERNEGIGAYQQEQEIKSHFVVPLTLLHFSSSSRRQTVRNHELFNHAFMFMDGK